MTTKQRKQEKKSRLILCMIGLIAAAVLSIVGSIFLFKNLNYGLDLQGGFEVLYKVESVDDKKVTDEMVTNTYKTMLKRIDNLGVVEPEVIVEGKDHIRVKLAGVKNPEEAREILSKAANLTFRDTSDNLLMASDVLNAGGAKVSKDSTGKPAVALSVKDKDKFYEVTNKVKDMTDNKIVIWLDFDGATDSFQTEAECGNLAISNCLSAASVSQAFASDVIIQGNFTEEQATELVDLINSGSLPTKLTELSSKTVGASFGEHTLTKTLTAGIIGIVCIFALVIGIYKFSGLVASVSVLIYTFVTFLTFWLIGGSLTLPGIAALILGIGMAVDSTVITFERIKDEIYKGKTLGLATKYGNKTSFLTILDANITTLIVAIIMFVFGESSVKGFATLLILSIIATMLIMVYVSRFLLNKFVQTGKFDDKLGLFIGIRKKFMKDEATGEQKDRFRKFDFVKHKSKFFALSILIIGVGLVSVIGQGFNLGIDFKGGSSITIKSNHSLNLADIEKEVNRHHYDIDTIEYSNGKNEVYVKITNEIGEKDIHKVTEEFNEKYDASTEIGVVSNIVKKQLIQNAILSILVGAIGIGIYVSLRFKLSYGISASVSLLHDVLVMIALFSIFRLEVSSMFIAAILAIVGYSINDTIVSFDRMRENIGDRKLKTKEELKEVVNLSIQETLFRSLVTTATTLIPVVALIFLGSHEIITFNIALLIGLVAGVYSTIFIACQLWLLIEGRHLKKKPKPKKKKPVKVEDELDEVTIRGVND